VLKDFTAPYATSNNQRAVSLVIGVATSKHFNYTKQPHLLVLTDSTAPKSLSIPGIFINKSQILVAALGSPLDSPVGRGHHPYQILLGDIRQVFLDGLVEKFVALFQDGIVQFQISILEMIAIKEQFQNPGGIFIHEAFIGIGKSQAAHDGFDGAGDKLQLWRPGYGLNFVMGDVAVISNRLASVVSGGALCHDFVC
jgi:hypothetical protein